jgi:hypothetical protein
MLQQESNRGDGKVFGRHAQRMPHERGAESAHGRTVVDRGKQGIWGAEQGIWGAGALFKRSCPQKTVAAFGILAFMHMPKTTIGKQADSKQTATAWCMWQDAVCLPWVFG